MANRKPVRPPTPRDRLDKYPQFEPGHSIPYHQVDFGGGGRLLFPPGREHEIRRLLTDFVGPHVQSGEWQGKPTSADRFTKNAMLAIATFEHRRSAEAKFDRKAAKEGLKRTVDSILDTCKYLEDIATNPELSQFLKSIFVSNADRKKKRTSAVA